MANVYVTGMVIGGEVPVGYKIDIMDGTTVVATANGIAGKEVAIPVPSPKLWSPASPFLYNMAFYTDSDKVGSYCGLRTCVYFVVFALFTSRGGEVGAFRSVLLLMLMLMLMLMQLQPERSGHIRAPAVKGHLRAVQPTLMP